VAVHPRRIVEKPRPWKALFLDPWRRRCEKPAVRLATWNIKHAALNGLDAIAQALRATDADLIALQEVDRGVARSGAVDQAQWLGDALGMSSGFAPALALEGGEYGIALLVRPGLIGNRPLAIKAIPLPGGTGPGEEPRVLLSARAGGQRVFVTHLDLPAGLREEQAEAIAIALGSPRGAVLLGDFNEGRVGRAVRRLIGLGLRDAWEDFFGEDRPTAPSDRPQERIDLVLLGEGVGPARAGQIIDSDASDHPIVVVDL
jgi:endonuclease/exonuclease/phosphatase family metal-dependent hydrolase